MKKLSVIIPVYNEAKLVAEIIRQVSQVPLPIEIIVVDDRSTDGSHEALKSLEFPIRLIRHEQNMGKGAAIRTGLQHATGDAVIVQDADLEYDPGEYVQLIRTLERENASVVYGSRVLGCMEGMRWSFRMGNRFLTWVTNLLYRGHLTDMETCYKLFKTDLLKSIPLDSNRFEFEPEVTAKLLKRGVRIVECPVTYRARGTTSGKKLRWTDGLSTLWCLWRLRWQSKRP